MTDTDPVEPALAQASSTDETTPVSGTVDIIFVTPEAVSTNQIPDTVGSAISNTAFSEQADSLVNENSIETVASLAVEGLRSLSGNDARDTFQAQVLRDIVLSEHLTSLRKVASATPGSDATSGVFDPAVNIAALFAAVQAQDPDLYAILAEESDRRQRDIEDESAASRMVIGSSATVLSGFSVGYLIYLLRGGAMMASMLTSLPAWRFVDPLPILQSMNNVDDTDNESLQTIVSGQR